MASTADISKLYTQYLGRDGSKDSEGVNYWSNEVASGKLSFDQVKQAIASSPEAQAFKTALPSTPAVSSAYNTAPEKKQRFDTGQSRATEYAKNGYAPSVSYDDKNTNASFLSAVYQNETGRDPDQWGFDYWMNEMANGMSRDQVIQAFNNTQEGMGFDNPLNKGLLNAGDASTGWASSPYSAVNRNVNADTDTVQGQLNTLLQNENPLMQRAYYKGLDLANSRGLLNSSMASEAAQAAMIDASLPIAQQDASTYYDQGTRNQGYQNEFNLNDRRYLQTAEQNALQRAHELAMQDSELGSSMAIERLKQNSGLYAQFLQGMSDINSADMDQGAKDSAMSALWDAIQQGTSMATALSGVRFEGGKLVYDEVPTGNGSAQVSQPQTPQENTTSMTWGDGGIYTPGVTRNSSGDLVDKNGNPAPQGSSSPAGLLGGGSQYELVNGEWKAVGGNYDYGGA